MRIFVTGASGWIGSATVSDLLEAGHEVIGLARSEASAQHLEAAGAIVHRGDLNDPDGLAKAAADSDGVIHLAFQHEVAFGGDFATAAAADRRAVEAMGAALAGSDRPLVLASGLLALAPGRVATEDDGLVPSDTVRANPAGFRAATGLFTLSLRGVGVRSSVLRFPPTVHGDGDNGFMATFVAIARQRGVAGYVGDGSNRWPAVHRSDAARLARLAVEAAPAGSVLHAVGDEGVPFREIADGNGPSPRRPDGVGGLRRRRRALRAPRALCGAGQSRDRRRHPEAAGMGADGADLARRSRAGPLLPPGVARRGAPTRIASVACQEGLQCRDGCLVARPAQTAERGGLPPPEEEQPSGRISDDVARALLGADRHVRVAVVCDENQIVPVRSAHAARKRVSRCSCAACRGAGVADR